MNNFSIKEGATISVIADAITPHGDGIARGAQCGERTLHIPGLFPQEQAKVRILELARRSPLGRARVLEREQSHPGRLPAPCPQHCSHEQGRCTGCPLMGLELSVQHQLKRDLLRQQWQFEVDRVVSQSPDHALDYRMSAKRVVGGRPGSLFLGSFRRDSHRLSDMAGCRVEHPRIRACAEELITQANLLQLEAYRPAQLENKARGQVATPAHGDLRYVWFKTDGEKVLVTLILGDASSRAARRLPEQLTLPAGISSCVQSGPGNSLRGHDVCHIRGEKTLHLEIAGQPMEVGALGFLQPNPAVAQMATLALPAQPDGTPIQGALAYDLYAGSGTTTSLLRQTFEEVIPCESFPESAAILGVPPQDAESFLHDCLSSTTIKRPELVIANPPRTGLGAGVCTALLELSAPRIHIMSCNPASLRKDLDRLASGYTLVALRAYDTLPQTPHLELVAWLEKKD